MAKKKPMAKKPKKIEGGRKALRAKKSGRPPREPQPGERFPLGLRVTPELKNALDEAAAHSGRSQSQEAEIRLSRSFERQGLLVEALTLTYDTRTAALLILIGLVMEEVGFVRRWQQRSVLSEPEGHWTSDPSAYEQALQGVVALLNAARPEGPIASTAQYGVEAAGKIVRAARGDSPEFLHPTLDGKMIRSLLTPISWRLKEQQS
jgi:hypothetical protein